MTKNSYDVSNPRVGETNTKRVDNSFKSCLCTMLLILAICILLLLLTWWCKFGLVEKKQEFDNKQYERIRYDPNTRTTHTEDKEEVTSTTTRRNTTATSAPTTISTYEVNVHKHGNTVRKEITTAVITTEKVETTTPATTLKQYITEKNIKKESTKAQEPTRIFNNTNEEKTTTGETLTEITTEQVEPSATLVPTENTITSEENTDKVKTTKTHFFQVNNDTDGEETTINAETTIGAETTQRNHVTTIINKKINATEEKSIFSSIQTTTKKEEPTTTSVKDRDDESTTGDSEITFESDLGVSTIAGLPYDKSNVESNLDICNSTECDLTAAHIISSMDISKAPCENFYEFACGGVSRNKREELDIFAPNLLMGEGTPSFIDTFSTFYHSCVRHEDRFHYQERIEKAKELLSNNIGLFQFDGQSNTTYNITEFVANLILFKAMPLFEVDVDVDPDNATYILKLLMPDQTSLELEHWSSLSESKRKCLRETEENAIGSPLNMTLLYRSFRECQKNYSDYLDSIETAVKELGFFEDLTEKSLFKHIRDIRVFIEIEILSLFDEIAPPPNLQEMVVRKRYENIKLGVLEKQFPLIQWENLFSMISNLNIDNETVIQMYNRPHLEEVFSGLSRLNRGMLNNAFLAILANSLFENTVLPVHRHSRVEYCKTQTKKLMPDIANYLYKKVTVSEELQEKNELVEKMFDSLRKQFNESLQNLDWLDDKSGTSIRNKMDAIELAMFRNDDILTEMVILEMGYSSLHLIQDDYQSNIFNLIEYRRKRVFSLQGETVTPENMFRHFVDASGEKPVFFYANDIVCIPYGLVKKTTQGLPAYITLAQVGFPLAKIIGQAFDPIGMQYRIQLSEDANSSYTSFAHQTRDMVVLSNPIYFGEREFFFTLNNALSESERIAENTALRLLTDSFSIFGNQSLLPWISNKYSREKIFFLAIAQEFCREITLMDFMVEAYESHVLPPQFRIENILGNSEEFLNQFHCRPGSAMTRIEDRFQFPLIPEVLPEDYI